jgi:predicted small lipoprotein YifL
MVAPHFGDSVVSRTLIAFSSEVDTGSREENASIQQPVPSRWAVILLTAAALALAGCGRKGGLDLPPAASAPPPPQANSQPATPGSLFDPSYGANKDPVAAKGQKRSFILDPLLND